MINIYNNNLVKLNDLLKRRYNNPLGEDILKLVRRILKGRRDARVLDVGCGRGASSIWLARNTKAEVVGVEPSAAMISAAKKRVLHVCHKIKFHFGTVNDLPRKTRYDIALALDVISWVKDKPKFLKLINSRLNKNGFFIFTGYFSNDRGSKLVKEWSQNWQIPIPPHFESYHSIFKKSGLSPIIIIDTSKKYYDHWSGVKAKLKKLRKKAVKTVGEEAVSYFEEKIQSILKAVKSGSVGHITAIAQNKR